MTDWSVGMAAVSAAWLSAQFVGRALNEYWRRRALHDRAQAAEWRARCLEAEARAAPLPRGVQREVRAVLRDVRAQTSRAKV